MREHKYRGITKRGEMVCGSLVVTTNFLKHKPKQHTKTWIVESSFSNGGWFSILKRRYVKPETVRQYTGLKDKNGVEIYEGDIIKVNTMIFSLSYENGSFVLFYEAKYAGRDKHRWGTLSRLFDVDMQDIYELSEVIGNIYENHELLDQK